MLTITRTEHRKNGKGGQGESPRVETKYVVADGVDSDALLAHVRANRPSKTETSAGKTVDVTYETVNLPYVKNLQGLKIAMAKEDQMAERAVARKGISSDAKQTIAGILDDDTLSTEEKAIRLREMVS